MSSGGTVYVDDPMSVNHTPEVTKPKKYVKRAKIGSGTYGSVYSAEVEGSDPPEFVALKKIKDLNGEEGFPATTLREIATLKTLDHPNIVLLKDIVTSFRNDALHSVTLVMELQQYDLAMVITKMGSALTDDTTREFARQLLSAADYIHSHHIIHRDIKPQNILVNSEMTVLKLADFGLARNFSVPLPKYTPEVQTLWYRAPELLLGTSIYSTSVDVWSIGCVIAELVNHRPVFPGKSEIDQLYIIFRTLGTPQISDWNNVVELPHWQNTFPQFHRPSVRKMFPAVSPSFRELILCLLCMNPANRITAKAALEHVLFNPGSSVPRKYNLRKRQSMTTRTTPTAPKKLKLKKV